MTLFDLYKRGMDTQALLDSISKKTRVPWAGKDEPNIIFDRVLALNDQLRMERELWHDCQPQPEAERLKYEEIAATYNKAIGILTDQAKALAKEVCIQGRVLSLGYRSPGCSSAAPSLVIIHPEMWPVLDIDFGSGSAIGEGYSFKAVRFIYAKDLTDDDYVVIGNALSDRTEEDDDAAAVCGEDVANHSAQGPTSKPWEIIDQGDPPPAQQWYTPARYFAREEVKKDATLLRKKDLLAKAVADDLKNVGQMKRGGKLPLDPATVKKAFVNVKLG